MDSGERRIIDSRGSKHTLTIRNVQVSDFGNYSCVAENSLGRAKKYMELSGEILKQISGFQYSYLNLKIIKIHKSIYLLEKVLIY